MSSAASNPALRISNRGPPEISVGNLGEEAKKQFLRSAFSRYVPPAVVDGIVADPSQLALGGDKKMLTVLFSDIRGFTTFSERLDAKQLVGFLNHYLGQMTDIVFAHRGTLDKYIGDAVVAFWGAPVGQDDHAVRAINAAIAMQQAVAAMRQAAQESWGIDLHVGIGLTSGVVNVGNMGSPTNFEYTVIGDRVNLASRLESLTKTYGALFLTTDDTLAEIARAGQPLPPHRVVDLVRVKGKHLAVTLGTVQVWLGQFVLAWWVASSVLDSRLAAPCSTKVTELFLDRSLVEVLVAPPDPAHSAGFEAARAQYLAREFAQAQAAFNQLYTSHGQKLYQLYAARCDHWQTVQPAADWSGEWDMESK